MYFKAHQPNATLIDDPRRLGEVLQWVASNVTAPIGNLYLVSHGNEDGTLAFGVEAVGDDHSMIRPRIARQAASGGRR